MGRYCIDTFSLSDVPYSRCIILTTCGYMVSAMIKKKKVGTLILSSYIGLDLASTVYKNISRISSTPKKHSKFLKPPKISSCCTFTLRKDHKIQRNDPLN